MRLARYVACVADNRSAYRVLVRKPVNHENIDVNEEIILKWITQKYTGLWTGFIRLGMNVNEGSVYMKYWECE